MFSVVKTWPYSRQPAFTTASTKVQSTANPKQAGKQQDIQRSAGPKTEKSS